MRIIADFHGCLDDSRRFLPESHPERQGMHVGPAAEHVLRIAFVFVSAQTTIGTPAFCAIFERAVAEGLQEGPDLLVPPSGKTAMEALSSLKTGLLSKSP